jgi:DNA repair protein RadD
MNLEQPYQPGLDLPLDQLLSPDAREISNGWLDVLPPTGAVKLRDYQTELLARISAKLRTHRRICVQAPTGSGKTTVFAVLVGAAVAAGLRVLVLATRTRLVRQIHDRLDSMDVRHGVIAASLPGLTAWSQLVQVASVDTLYRRCVAGQKMPLPGADVVVFDEAHLALGASRQAILNSYPNAWQFGFTATPAKTSGASLRDQFDALILGPSAADLVAARTLVRPRIFNTPIVSAKDLKSVGTDGKTGDYKTGKLSSLMSRPKLIGDVVENWLAIANGQRTLVFACDKAHGAELLLKFRQAGVAAEQLTDDDDDDTREEVIARLEAGATTVVINCFLLSYGIDIPLVDCVVLARPTRSVVMYLQSIGRGMRPAPGKEYFTLIDHGRVIDSLGRPLYDRDWSLDSSSNVNAEARERMDRQSAEEKPRTCRECKCSWLVTEEGADCPNCGWHPTPAPKPVQVVDALLVESKEAPLDREAMEKFFREACQWYANRWPDRWQEKPNSGRYWAWSQTRTKFKRPDDEAIPRRYWDLQLRPTSVETAGWLKSQMIRFAKGKAKEAARAAA